MKLIPILQAGGLKKALALAGIGVAGVAYKGTHQEDPNSEHNELDIAMKDSIRLNFVTDQANRKGNSADEKEDGIINGMQATVHNIALIVRAIQSAWAHSPYGSSSPSDKTTSKEVPSINATSTDLSSQISAALASVLSELAVESDGTDSTASSLRKQLSTSWVVRCILTAAAMAPPDSKTFADAATFLTAVLHHPDSAAELFSHSGIPSLVLEIAAASPQVYQAALNVLNQLQHPLAPTCRADITHVAHIAGQLQQSEPLRVLSLRLLRIWAERSVSACANMAEIQLGTRLGEIAGSCIPSQETQAREETVLLMCALARDTPGSSLRTLRMESWLYPLLCFAADAVGEGHQWSLVEGSLSAFSACVRRGIEIPPRLLSRSVLPLLQRMADKSSSLPLRNELLAVRALVAKTVLALAEGSGVVLSQEERMSWAEVMLRWITLDINLNTKDNSRTEKVCVDALAALAHPQGVAGLQVAHVWLAEMITYLSREVEKAQAQAAKELEMKKKMLKIKNKKSSGVAAGAHQSDGGQGLDNSTTSDSSFYYDWYKPSYWWGTTANSSSSTADGIPASTTSSTKANLKDAATAAFAAQAAASQRQKQHQLPLIVSEEILAEAEEPATAEPIVVQQATAVLGPTAATETNHHYSSSLSSSNGTSTNTSSSRWTAWLPAWTNTVWSSLPTLGTYGSSTSDAINNSSSGDEESASGSSRLRSDSELALYINAAPVGPAFARAIARELVEASGRVGHYSEPPADAEEALSPAAMAAYSAVSAAVDVEVADRALAQALKVLSAMALGDEKRRGWLVGAGLLKVLRRVAMERGNDVEIEAIYSAAAQAAGESNSNDSSKSKSTVDAAAAAAVANWEQQQQQASSSSRSSTSLHDVIYSTRLGPLRQAIRMVALVSVDLPGAAAVACDPGWLQDLQELTGSDDCKVSSCAAKALLNIESAAAVHKLIGDDNENAVSDDIEADISARLASAREQQQRDQQQEEEDLASTIKSASTAAIHKLRRQLNPILNSLGNSGDSVDAEKSIKSKQELRLVLHDGIHLFDPLAPHHEVLALEGTATDSPDAPLLDIVFVHGIRGGAFATWRREGVLERGAARDSLEKAACWPTSWLVPDLGPRVRLISAEYAAPASAWEGESLPFPHIAEQIAAKLAAAGVGRRPVVFITHSMGGLVVKEILAQGKEPTVVTSSSGSGASNTATLDTNDIVVGGTEAQKRLRSAAAGVVFYSVPHAGSRLADWGWTLRYVGVSPAKAVAHLTTGPHVDALNNAVRGLARAGLPILSFSEGLPTQLAYVKTHIVPHESAYPGYGEFVVLHEHDHISVCKPRDKEDPSYAVLIKFLKTVAEK